MSVELRWREVWGMSLLSLLEPASLSSEEEESSEGGSPVEDSAGDSAEEASRSGLRWRGVHGRVLGGGPGPQIFFWCCWDAARGRHIEGD